MEDPIVTVKEGKLSGAVKQLCDGSLYYTFKGIPYSQPPVGELRFKAPQPLIPWKGIYSAIEHGPICPQLDMMSMKILEGNENCLFLNVYTKSLRVDTLRPVMVFIHGGGYITGSGNSDFYGPEFIMQHEIVLVTINYRLEVLGFLCLDTPEVPGNAGIKDQVAALRWIQNNITQFGGDPNNVTIFGESAGSASVTFHMLSPMSKGLFHKVIAQSGVCASDWGLGKDGKERAFRVGKVLGKETKDTEELLQFLRTVPAVELAALTLKTVTKEENHRNLTMHFCPVVEKEFKGVEAFLTENPLVLLKSNKIYKVPLIIGYTSNESIFTRAQQLKYIDIWNKHIKYTVPREIAEKLSDEKMTEFGKRIKQFYIGDNDYHESQYTELSHKESDSSFVYSIHRFIHIYSIFNKEIYMYRFSYDTELNYFKRLLGWSHVKGAGHTDDLFYIFCHGEVKSTYEKDDKLKAAVFKVTKLWTNFAAFGDPTPDDSLGIRWPQYTTKGKEFLDINEILTSGQYAEQNRVEFWDKLYQEAGLLCIADTKI